MKKPYLIAEIGINHNGDVNIAKELIKMQKVAGSMLLNFRNEQ